MATTEKKRYRVTTDARVTGALVPWVLNSRSRWQLQGLEFSNLETLGSRGMFRDNRELYFTVSGDEEIVNRFEESITEYKDGLSRVQIEYVVTKENYEVTEDLFKAYFGVELKKPRHGRSKASTSLITDKATLKSFQRSMEARGITTGLIK